MTKSNKTGNLLASIGGLFTILSLTLIEDRDWKVVAAFLGVAFALSGILFIKKPKKE